MTWEQDIEPYLITQIVMAGVCWMASCQHLAEVKKGKAGDAPPWRTWVTQIAIAFSSAYLVFAILFGPTIWGMLLS